jgi:hypothetical protein
MLVCSIGLEVYVLVEPVLAVFDDFVIVIVITTTTSINVCFASALALTGTMFCNEMIKDVKATFNSKPLKCLYIGLSCFQFILNRLSDTSIIFVLIEL